MPITDPVSLSEVENSICEVLSEKFDVPRDKARPQSRLLKDLHFDSLEATELFLEVEDRFGVTIPQSEHMNGACSAVFNRSDFRIADLAEIVYLQQGSGKPVRRTSWRGHQSVPQLEINNPFCQLSGRWESEGDGRLLEKIKTDQQFLQYRRRSDGMRCVLVPVARVEVGTDSPGYDSDVRPPHGVKLDAFLIDVETVSTTAYCRFLNSIGCVDQQVLLDWFVLADEDDRIEQQLIEQNNQEWRPIAGCEHLPMILVSWYGANAYSLWANGHPWNDYRSEGETPGKSFLPTEAQWEYAARGPDFKEYPWGNEAPTAERMRFSQHVPAATYTAVTIPMEPVNSSNGMSPFGLHHMAGNVWEWCRDWYSPDFYSTPEATLQNPVNSVGTGVRSERGGSWVGPADLCRSSHRRGRAPEAKGRCLGFRCISDMSAIG
ncbi:Serine/threonine-protein kinase pkn1 [Polystyrenella longa]|uniref:Serine/threonine-protein kinase pkn1 n=1 Tax=Polystyrenella longa TaxID=2528007 RepID=A0A518CRH3_9PLAN|nr:SUMF1/EgtB/PvdO family nonheme iron enzyme [Polystyrenella longa]QDU81815.1 Serine/threonine-protein kinase pkn1 [Polystyrenella longa]